MKKSHIVKLILFPLILTGCALSMNFLVFAKVDDSLTSYGQFYQEIKDSLDVAFIGNSTLREGFIPLDLWNDYGITSRGLSSSPTHPEVIKNAIPHVIDAQHPKVMFIDINGLTFQQKANAEFFIKQYYSSITNVDYKKDLEEKYSYLKDKGEEFELFKNHNNFRQQQYWESIVYPAQFKTKGYYPNRIIYKVKTLDTDPNLVMDLPSGGKEYYEDILSVCDTYKDEVKFVFTKMPRFNSTKGQLNETYMLRSIKDDIASRGYTFYDFSEHLDDIGLLPNQDFKDFEHLNHLGAKKFTNYFGKYLTEAINLKVKTHSDEVIDDFNKAYFDTYEFLKKIEDKLNRKANR